MPFLSLTQGIHDMTTATRKRRLYKIDQLEPDARRLALERFQEWRNKTWDSYDNETVSEPMQYKLKEHYGLTNCELSWRLSCCQGDGVAFTGNPDIYQWVKHDEHLAMLYLKLSVYCRLLHQDDPQLSISIVSTSHHYSHYNTMHLEVTNCASWDEEEHDGQELYQMQTDIEEYLQELIKDISRDLERIGYDEIEYQSSEEYLNDNEYRFTANGHRYKRK